MTTISCSCSRFVAGLLLGTLLAVVPLALAGLAGKGKAKGRRNGCWIDQNDDGETYDKTNTIAHGVTELIGNTPLIRIQSLSELTGCEILAKAEFLNPGGSSKDRLALALVNDAEAKGLIKPNRGDTLYEGTVGSTGISLAMIAKARGYNCYIVMPDDQAAEKYAILEHLGATIEKVRPVSIADPNHFTRIALKRAEAVNAGLEPQRALFCDQFETKVNYQAHLLTTGPEIMLQTKSRIDAFVMGAGTGGTLAGVGHHLKAHIPTLKIVLADPYGSGLYNKAKHGVMYSTTEREGSRARHQVDTVVEGIGSNRMTGNLARALAVVDDAISVSDEEAVEMSRWLLNNDGIFIGSSSAVNCAAAVKLAKQMKKGSVIVTLLCDHGSRHLTKFWSPIYLQQHGIYNIQTIAS